MRHEAILPAIGNLAAEKMPKLVFINDPVSGVHYSLNAADKTTRKMPVPAAMEGPMKRRMPAGAMWPAPPSPLRSKTVRSTSTSKSAHSTGVAGGMVHVTEFRVASDKMLVKNESLGSKVIDGVAAQGTRSIRTIPAGEIGNYKLIEIVSESWYSNELKTVVYSKRTDPRSGDTIYSLTNISRSEPDASLFAPPADDKAADANAANKDVIIFKAHE